MPSRTTAFILLAVSVLSGAASGIIGNGPITALIAIITAMIALISLPGTNEKKMVVVSLVCAVSSVALSAGISFIINGRFDIQTVFSGGYALVALAMTLSVYRLKSRLFTETVGSVLICLLYIGIIAVAVYGYYGRLDLSVLKEIENGLRSQITEIISTLDVSGSEISAVLGKDEIAAYADTIIVYMKLLSPSILYISASVAVHIALGIFRLVLMGYARGRRRMTDWLLGPTKSVAWSFNVSALAVTLLETVSLFSESSVITALIFGFGNIALLTLPSCCSFGFRRIWSMIKQRQPQAVMLIAIIAMVACCNPIFVPFFLAISGANGYLIKLRNEGQRK